MSTFYIKSKHISDGKVLIEGDDANHIKNVLRYKVGDNVNICDENGTMYQSIIRSFGEKSVDLLINGKIEKSTESPIKITLFQGLPKSDKMDWIIQKAIELGVSEIVPVEMERSVAKLHDKDSSKKVERWNRIAYEAAKQCGRQYVPRVSNVDILKNIVEKFSKYDIVLLPYEREFGQNIKQVLHKYANLKNVAVVIGPEGGFSENDLSLLNLPNMEMVTLGPRILRTETASLAVLAMLSYEIEFER